MGRLFGTDGVRGIANIELTPELAFKIGQVGAYILTEQKNSNPKILVGKDTRISGDMLEAALISGICSVGAIAISLGVVPTPAVAYLIKKYNADSGVVISASHNPVEYNGIKYFNSSGYKLNNSIEERIESIILDKTEEIPLSTGVNIGSKMEKYEAIDDYIKFVKSTIEHDLRGIKIAVDCANGASYYCVPKILSDLGADVIAINNNPNGININGKCGSTHMVQLQKSVIELGVDLGLAFDGDADRVLAIDEKGNILDGDQIIAICAEDLKKRNKLKNNTFVVTVMSNLGLSVMAKNKDINIVKTKVGDRYVIAEMKNKGYVFGGEQSGHIIFHEYNTTGDGIITGLQLLSIIKRTGKKLSELSSIMQVLPQVLVNAKVCNTKKEMYKADKEICERIKRLEDTFNGNGRVLIRPSGTEPLIRIMIEGQDRDYLQKKAEELAALMEKKLK